MRTPGFRKCSECQSQSTSHPERSLDPFLDTGMATVWPRQLLQADGVETVARQSNSTRGRHSYRVTSRAEPISGCFFFFFPTTTPPWALRDRCLASWGVGEEADKCLLRPLCGPVKHLGVNVRAPVYVPVGGCGGVRWGCADRQTLDKNTLAEPAGPVVENRSERVGRQVTRVKKARIHEDTHRHAPCP